MVSAVVSRIGHDSKSVMPVIYSANISTSDWLDIIVLLPEGMATDIRSLKPAFAKAFPQLELRKVSFLQDVWHEQTASERMSLIILSTVTLLTMLLAAIGVAGLTLMSTHQKKYELAIRMATGASQGRLLRFILQEALWILVIGLGLGFVLSVFGYDWLQSKLSLLPDFNWLTLTWLDASLTIIVLLSVIIPAWQVIRRDPISALRQE